MLLSSTEGRGSQPFSLLRKHFLNPNGHPRSGLREVDTQVYFGAERQVLKRLFQLDRVDVW